MNPDYNNLRTRFHDLKSRATSFNTGITLLKERLINSENYPEIVSLMDDALKQVNEVWSKLKSEIENSKMPDKYS